MHDEQLLFALLIGLAALILVPLGLLMVFTDLSCIFCFYQNNGIYLILSKRRVSEDTTQNRRAISRKVGVFFLGVVFAAFLFLFLLF